MHTAAAPSNLDAAITMRFAKTKLQNAIELRAMASEIAAPKRRLPSKSESGRCESDAFVRDFLQILQVEVVKMKLELPVPLQCRSGHDPGPAETISQPPAGQASPSIFRGTFCLAKHSSSCIRRFSKTHFVRDVPQKVKAEDLKTKLSCETSPKKL